MSETRQDDALFGRLRRMIASATTAHQRDRRNVLSLECDIRMLRAELNQRCAVLTEQMKEVGTRTTAINAYARTGSLACGASQPRHK